MMMIRKKMFNPFDSPSQDVKKNRCFCDEFDEFVSETQIIDGIAKTVGKFVVRKPSDLMKGIVSSDFSLSNLIITGNDPKESVYINNSSFNVVDSL